MRVLALIPARRGSKGIEGKNFRNLAGRSPVLRAIDCARATEPHAYVVVTTDAEEYWATSSDGWPDRLLQTGPPLHTDECAMIDVVTHALAEIPGPDEQIIILVQPTQPLRQPKHLKAAIELLEASGADSVVSVVELPKTHHPEFVLIAGDRGLQHWTNCCECLRHWPLTFPARRQDVGPAYIRDGTVYAFRRRTVTQHGDLYGEDCRPLIIPPEETCPLDSPAEWAEAERRLRALS